MWSRTWRSPAPTVLLAEDADASLGLLAFSLHPGLFHGGESGFIEELVVTPTARRQGVGGALLQEALRRIEQAGCREVSIATGFENHEAQRLYRGLGLVEESLLLEKHLPPSP
jgi:ribosomal protein S18 acetylase RimI-like enzyme